MDTNGGPHGPTGSAGFLLAQVGAHAAMKFAEGIAELDLTPPQAGLLFQLIQKPGRSQRELADSLGMPPSRFVPFADTLEQRGLIERRRNPEDRRVHALYLTEQGMQLLGRLRKAGMAHDQRLCAALSEDERHQLISMLNRIAVEQGLKPGIHPGYRMIR